MNRINVESSMINSIGYDETNSILEIEFKSDRSVWHYYDVPDYIFQEFRYAGSKGKFFHRNIKGQFTESRVG